MCYFSLRGHKSPSDIVDEVWDIEQILRFSLVYQHHFFCGRKGKGTIYCSSLSRKVETVEFLIVLTFLFMMLRAPYGAS